MKLGFIGTGNITSALVEGLGTVPISSQSLNITVSPRNAEKAARLDRLFDQVSIAADNQAVIQDCNPIVLALRPQAAVSVLKKLQFSEDQEIISLMAATPLPLLRDLTAPARHICRALPLPSVAQKAGPIILYPNHTYACEILGKVGTLFPVDDEKQLEILWAVTALISPYYALMETVSEWAINAGTDASTAQGYIPAMFLALSKLVSNTPTRNFADLIIESATPGGLNEQALAIIRARSAYTSFVEALNSIADRLGINVSDPED